MNASEEKMLQDFLDQLVQARGVTKDPEAAAAIERAVARQPDAAYLLVQRALLVEQALGNARARIAELERQVNGSGGGFLDANAWGHSAHGSAPGLSPAQQRPANPVPGMGAGAYPAQAAPMAPQAAPARSGGFLGGAGSMLGTVAATAAGVAAGSFLFHGIGNLLDHDGQGASNHLLAGNAGSDAGGAADAAGGGALADQAGIGSIDEPGGDSVADSNDDSLGGFFDGDGSDEGLFG